MEEEYAILRESHSILRQDEEDAIYATSYQEIKDDKADDTIQITSIHEIR